MAFLPGLPGNFLGIQPSSGSDASIDLSADYAPHLSLRQYCVGSVATGSFTSSPGIHAVGEGNSSGPDTDTYGWAPCTASFTEDTLPGSLLVCVGVLNADFFGGLTDNAVLAMDAGLDGWAPGYSFATASIFNKSGLCAAIAGGITQVPQADCVLTYHRNAPVVAAGTLFYGGVNAADWCNSFSYQMILAEFEVDGATLDSFSYNTATVDNSGDPLSVTGRLPSDNPSFAIAVTWNNPGNSASAGSGFALGPASSLGSQWQWQEFAPQDGGYSGSNFPSGCPGLSGSFELGFAGVVAAGVTPVGVFIWNVLPTGGGGGGGGGADVGQFQPNVFVVS